MDEPDGDIEVSINYYQHLELTIIIRIIGKYLDQLTMSLWFILRRTFIIWKRNQGTDTTNDALLPESL